MNAVVQNMVQLKRRNYVLKAKSAKHWFGWDYNRVEKLRQQSGDDFYLILYWDDTFFIIPYETVKHILKKAPFVEGAAHTKRRRWDGTINTKTNKLKLNSNSATVDLTQYEGNMRLLNYAIEAIPEGIDLSPDEGDTEIPYLPIGKDTRLVVLQHILARQGKQKFRDELRIRYGNLCLISGCTLMDIVEAAHIKPYRGVQDNHPANGLLLRADLHTLFDLNFIGIEPDTLMIHVHPDARLVGYDQFHGGRLLCGKNQPSPDALKLKWQAFNQKCNARPEANRAKASTP
jgi:hypothetical protein